MAVGRQRVPHRFERGLSRFLRWNEPQPSATGTWVCDLQHGGRTGLDARLVSRNGRFLGGRCLHPVVERMGVGGTSSP